MVKRLGKMAFTKVVEPKKCELVRIFRRNLSKPSEKRLLSRKIAALQNANLFGQSSALSTVFAVLTR
jgi:hypothetical protein